MPHFFSGTAELPVKTESNQNFIAKRIILERYMYRVSAAYCYGCHVLWSLCLCVEHTAKRCKNGWADHDAVSVVDSRTAKEPCIRLGAHRRHLANMIKRSVLWGKPKEGSKLLDLGTWPFVVICRYWCLVHLRYTVTWLLSDTSYIQKLSTEPRDFFSLFVLLFLSPVQRKWHSID